MGPTADLDRLAWGYPTECYYSCPLCDELTSWDWTTCYDDIGFMDLVINHVADYWCIDMNQIHLSGISNGGINFFLVLVKTGKILRSKFLSSGRIPKTVCFSNKLPAETNKTEVKY